MNRKFIHLFILFPIFLSAIVVYAPGINGPYVLDDGENITLNKAVAMNSININTIYDAALSNNSLLKRPLAALSFGLNHYFSGGFENTRPFKITNLVIHLCNSVLIYALILLLLKSPGLQKTTRNWNHPFTAGLATAAWALHPIQLTSVLYVVQRMTGLSALFVLAGLIVFVRGRHLLSMTGGKGLPVMYAGIVAGTVLGLGAKENAILLPLFALTIEYVLFKRDRLTMAVGRKLWFFYIILILVPLLVFFGYLLLHPEFISNGYLERHFTLFERLLTQSRVLWFYISLILFPSVHRLGLFHDDILISHGMFDPLSTLPALIGIGGIILFAILKARQYPIIAFAVLWFISGHVLESSIFPLQIAYEHRNYLPSLGILFAAILYIRTLMSKISKTNAVRYAIPFLLILSLGYSTWSRAYTWSDITILAESEALNHPNSGNANDFAARVNLNRNGDISKTIGYVIKGMNAAPDEVGFNIDLRIYLAALSAEISQTLFSKGTSPTASTSELEIKGLPSSIKVSVENKTLSLTHEASSGNMIHNILRNKPISVHGVTTLESLSDCILDQLDYCAALKKDALVWLKIAANNPRTSSSYRAIVLSKIARLYASDMDFIHAYEYINLASLAAPSRLAYQLGRIEYLIRLGRLGEAKQLLDNYNLSGKGGGIERRENERTVTYLLKMYQESGMNKSDR
jgi:hypothetical protein